jgi:hypothetical protein
MELLVLLPLVFIFLYCLYKLIKDDYVFIRRSFYPEQVFDIAFGVLLISLIISRFSYLVLHFQGANIFTLFFSTKNGEFSFIGAIIGGLIGLYLMAKYKKVPLGRIFDFFTLAFSVTLPLGLLLQTLFIPKSALLLHFIMIGLYMILTLIFFRSLYPKLINRTLKEGSLTILFLMFLSIILLLISLLASFKHINTFLTIQNGVVVSMFIFSTVLMIKQERNGGRGRKPVNK